MTILTKEEAANAEGYFEYPNGDYSYKADGFDHLIRDGVDLLAGKNATWCYSYKNGDYEYRTDRTDGKAHYVEAKKMIKIKTIYLVIALAISGIFAYIMWVNVNTQPAWLNTNVIQKANPSILDLS